MKALRIASLVALLSPAGCATYWQASRLEEKVDLLLKNTKRETLAQIFGDQTLEITRKMETLSSEEKQSLDKLVDGYQQGNATLDDVRSNMLSVLGGSTRVVASGRGVWLRDSDGKKLLTLGREGKIEKCERLLPTDLPETITNQAGLASYSWGRGEVNGQTVLFPWELTMSEFAKEIVENTARRTAQEIIRMTGDRGWSKPVQIKVVTDVPGQSVTVEHSGSEEVYVVPEEPAKKGGDKK
jgi:hypothetical protein